MRQKADKLEKGKWYADVMNNALSPVFLKFSHKTDTGYILFSLERNGPMYNKLKNGMIRFFQMEDNDFYVPTAEDIEKYNLNEE